MKNINNIQTQVEKDVYNDIINKCKNFQVVSFDLFDTITFRPYKTPSDVFLDISQKIKDLEFYKARINAEKKAIQQKGKNINIDNIYACIPEKFKKVQKIEEETEIRIANKNISVVEAIKELKNGNKKIIITTDMYLKEKTINAIVNKLGIADYIDKIYISCEIKKSKSEGNIYNYILKDLNITKDDIIHFGDNKKSDYEIPISIGICAHKIEKINDIIYKDFLDLLDNSLESSKYYSLCKYSLYSNCNYWENIGYILGGPIALSFLNYIQKIQEKEQFDALWFIARDGYILKEIYEKIFKSETPCDYVFASRNLINNAKTNENCYKEYEKYLSQLKTSQKTNIGIVDLTTLNFTAQKFISSFYSNKKITGIYWLSNKGQDEYKYYSMFYRPNKIGAINFLIETLITAPHQPVNSIKNCLPIYETNNKQENSRCEIYKHIANGILEFIEDIKEVFDFDFSLTNNNLVNIITSWINKMSKKDLDYFKQISHNDGVKNINLDYYFNNNCSPKVSVIVSVYNMEKYLPECLDSIINQTLENIEIICINDGSTDKSLKILNQYKEKDPRIIIIDQKNKGLSTSRNAALEMATGKYCAFIDSDDYIERNTLSELYQYATKNNLDMLSFSGYNFDSNNKQISNPYWDFTYLPKNWNRKVFTYKDCLSFMNKMAVSSCLTMYNLNFIIKNKIKFPDGLVYEDNIFWTKAFTKNAKFGILNKKFYKRRLHNESITHNWEKNIKDWIKICDMLLEYLKSINIDKSVFEDYRQSRIRTIIDRFNKLSDDEKSHVKEEVDNFMDKYKTISNTTPTQKTVKTNKRKFF